ncbi:MAG: hypothetical protein IT331_14050 [Anaerolineae bacterium]|nr:hypothetical protein [Anaerolineae bacterium]
MFDQSLFSLSRRAFLRIAALSSAVLALDACGTEEPPREAPDLPPIQQATATLSPQAADVTARIFLDAWSRNNFPGMYAALAPAAQTRIAQSDFVARYNAVMREATITKILPTLTNIVQEGATATAQFHVKYETALLGDIEQDNVFSMVREGGKWGIVWSPRLLFKELEGNNRVKLYITKSTRGNIYDAQGEPIAIGVKAIVVNVWPAEMRRQGTEPQVLASLEPILGMSQEDIRARYVGQNAEWKIPIQTISQDLAQLNAASLSLPGVVVEEVDARQYPLGAAAGHIAGYVGQITAQELDDHYAQGYREGENFGRAGLEQLGEKYVSGGRGGRLVALNAEGAQVRVIAERATSQSSSIYSTIDSSLQTRLAALLEGKHGSIVVMDVRNGNILGMYSNPGFDPNAFVDRERSAERANYLTSPQNIMFNRATQGLYPHGSVQKIITTAAAIERGGLSPNSTFRCNGIWNGIGYPKACWINAYGKTHGNITLKNGLVQSCGVVYYETGLLLHARDPMLLTDFCYAFGLGSKTGIGLEESAGNVPDPTKQEWQPTDSTDTAVGQDTFQVSPLQVVDFVAAVANGGTLWRPNLIARVEDFVNGTSETITAQKRGDLPVSADALQIVREAMHGVTASPEGTAAFNFDKFPVSSAGKTGTAQVPGNHDPHAWFAGFAPYENPQIAVVVMIENGGEGSKVAAPLFRKVLEQYFDIKPTPTPARGTPQGPTPTPPPSE